MKNLLAYVIILPALFNVSCKKLYSIPTPTLPAETHSGKNTFGCYVNGQLWLPQGSISPPWGPILRVTLHNGELQVSAYKVRQPLLLDLNGVTDTGRYDIVANNNSAGFGYFQEDHATSGHVDIKFIDPVNRIVSGTFSFVGNSVSVTQGRFDLGYTLY